MKRKYIKPSFQFVEIITNDLCAGSVCTTIDMKIVPLKEKKTKTYILKDTEGMWDSKF